MIVLSLFDGMSCGYEALKRAGIPVTKYYASEIDKYAHGVAKFNHPDIVSLGDINTWREWDIEKPDLIIGGSPCFTANNLVMTREGYKPIKDIKVGDYVLTHKNRYKKVLRVGSTFKKAVKIKAQGSTEIETTHNHPFYAITDTREYKNSISQPEWIEIQNLNEKHKLLSLQITDEQDTSFSDIDLYILGRFLADGCCYKTKRKNRKNSYIYKFKISIGKHKIEDFKKKVDDRFSYIEDKTAINAYIYQQKWVEMGERFGKYAHNKFIPNFILNLPVDKLKIFINGYMDGDGCLRKNGYKRATTVSEKLALTLSLAIQKCFYGVSINKTKRPKKRIIEGREVNQRNTYEITYNENHLTRYVKKVKDYYLGYNFRITGRSQIEKRVYNIEVEDDNSYIVNNLIVHNCQGFSLAGKGLAFDDPRSKLFFTMVDIIEHYKPKYRLLENVRMKKDWLDTITQYMKCDPVCINSALMSAQNRIRYYWANWCISQPEDKGILLKDVIHEEEVDRDKAYCIDANYYKGGDVKNYLNKKRRQLIFEQIDKYKINYDKAITILEKETEAGKIAYIGKDSQGNSIYTIHKKSVTISASGGGRGGHSGLYLFGCITPERINKRQNGQRFNDGQKIYTLTAQDKHGILIEGYIRKLTPIECERLQTLPDNYTAKGIIDGKEVNISNTQRYKMIGNGWTVDVIKHIFDCMQKSPLKSDSTTRIIFE